MSAPPRVHSRNGETVSVIGAGRVGTALAVALRKPVTDVAVSTVSTVDRTNRAPGPAALLPAPPMPSRRRGGRAPPTLRHHRGARRRARRRWCAASPPRARSGPASSSSTRPARTGWRRCARPPSVGALTAAVHPAMTFTGDRRRPRGSPTASRSASPPGRRPAAGPRALVADLGGIPEWIAEDATAPLYHAALAHGANHLVTLVNEARDRLRDAGVRRPRAGARARCCRPRSTTASRSATPR